MPLSLLIFRALCLIGRALCLIGQVLVLGKEKGKGKGKGNKSGLIGLLHVSLVLNVVNLFFTGSESNHILFPFLIFYWF